MGRGVGGVGGVSGAVLNSAESHWMSIQEEDVEESCNNRRSESRGHKSYDSKWAFFLLQAAGESTDPRS